MSRGAKENFWLEQWRMCSTEKKGTIFATKEDISMPLAMAGSTHVEHSFSSLANSQQQLKNFLP